MDEDVRGDLMLGLQVTFLMLYIIKQVIMWVKGGFSNIGELKDNLAKVQTYIESNQNE